MSGQAEAYPAGFDRMAEQYDALWTATPVGRAQRELVWRHVDRLFGAGHRLLDIGCGTGADAAHFASRGVEVHAIDVSPAMVRAARARGRFRVSELRAEEIGEIRGSFDGVLSNFGALNCVEDLSPVVRGLARVVRPGGRVAVCTLGRFCLWETLYYACRLQFGKAVRRWRGQAPSSLGITVHYPTVAQLARAFSPYFAMERWTGIGMLVPPSYVHMPASLVRALGVLDRLPLLRSLADHRLLILVRK